MTEEKIEDFAYDFIRFLKKWNLWENTVVDCNGKRYFDYETDCGAETYTCGFRSMHDICVCDSDPVSRARFLDEEGAKKGAAIVVECGSELHVLMLDHICMLDFYNLPNDTKQYLIEKYELREMALENGYFPLLDDTEFDSYDEYMELELEMEDEMMDDIWFLEFGWGETDFAYDVLQEMKILCQRHHICYKPVGYYCYGIAFYPMDGNGTAEGGRPR